MDIQAELQSLPLFSGCDDPTCELLPEGRTNRNYRVDTGGQVYFVRLSAPGHAEHGIDRRKEYAAIENLHTAGLGPRPIYFCPENQIIVTEFIDAPTWTLDKLKTPDALGSFGRAIADLHRLPSGDAVYDIVEVARHYLDELRGSDVVSSADLHLLSKARDLVADLCDETDFGMCHNDLWYGNVIDDGGIKIIDEEIHGSAEMFVVADGNSGRAAVFEMAVDGVERVELDSDGVVWATNHFAGAEELHLSPSINSTSRYERLRQLLDPDEAETVHGSIDLDTAAAILRDTTDGHTGETASPDLSDGADTVANNGCIQSIIFAPEQRTLYLAEGDIPIPQNPFVGFTLDELFELEGAAGAEPGQID